MPHFDSANFEVCEKTGNLVMTVDCDAASELRAAIVSGDIDYWSTMADLFEQSACNGSFAIFDAGNGDPFVGLTDAPCVAESMHHLDDGTMEVEGRLWFSPNYAMENELQTLAETGRFVWALASV